MELGGKYKGKKENNISQWMDEQWVSVPDYLKGNIVKCGTLQKTTACRPLIRINKDTPITIPELLKIHSKKKILELSNEKQKNPNIRIDWKLGKINK